jgi:hypothetical protein
MIRVIELGPDRRPETAARSPDRRKGGDTVSPASMELLRKQALLYYDGMTIQSTSELNGYAQIFGDSVPEL